MSEQIIDSDHIEGLIVSTISRMTGCRTEVSLVAAKANNDACCLTFNICVLVAEIAHCHQISVSCSWGAYDEALLLQYFEQVAVGFQNCLGKQAESN